MKQEALDASNSLSPNGSGKNQANSVFERLATHEKSVSSQDNTPRGQGATSNFLM